MNNRNNWRNRLAKGEVVLGTHVFSGDPIITEVISLVGFDLVWIDMEHTSIDKSQVMQDLIAVKAGGSGSVVRIQWNDPVLAKPILDMGPDGIIFPYIRSAKDARTAVASCEYPPEGIRGFGPMRAIDYGMIDSRNYVDGLQRETLRFLQIEHIDAVDCLDELLEVPGIDGFIIGPNDLSGSVNHIGQPNHPDMNGIYDYIGKKLSGRVPFGVSTNLIPEVISQWKDRGATIFFAGYDIAYIREGAVKTLGEMAALTGCE